uniref:Uncharacterized protein n=2 Tax=Oryza TaxID=4527 RepID=Q652F1_ORYSJ|nr:hypothetical protein [Oryza sativa Japonica Group]BAD46316.1 hypothetical protein [Oryza sativa Japonica Group]
MCARSQGVRPNAYTTPCQSGSAGKAFGEMPGRIRGWGRIRVLGERGTISWRLVAARQICRPWRLAQ